MALDLSRQTLSQIAEALETELRRAHAFTSDPANTTDPRIVAMISRKVAIQGALVSIRVGIRGAPPGT